MGVLSTRGGRRRTQDGLKARRASSMGTAFATAQRHSLNAVSQFRIRPGLLLKPPFFGGAPPRRDLLNRWRVLFEDRGSLEFTNCDAVVDPVQRLEHLREVGVVADKPDGSVPHQKMPTTSVLAAVAPGVLLRRSGGQSCGSTGRAIVRGIYVIAGIGGIAVAASVHARTPVRAIGFAGVP